MKLVIDKTSLNLATARMQGAITERSLAQIGLRASGGTLQIAATDRVLAVYSDLECKVETTGTIFVPARLFSDVVKELPNGDVQLELQGAYLVITAGDNGVFTMKIPIIDDLNWREPPSLDESFAANSADVPTNKLSYIIEQVQFCVAQDSPRNYGSVGFLHRPANGSVRLVGTDGFRLSYCEMDSALPDSFLANGVCLSKRALSEIHRMCGDGFSTIKISIAEDETTLVAQVPGYSIFIRLSAVKYPNYVGVLPKKSHSGVVVGRSQIQSVTKRVLLAADKSRALQLCFANSSLTLNSKTMGSSEGRETIQLDDYQGDKFDVAVNGKFLTDVFQTTSSDNLLLQFNPTSTEEPMVIVPRTEPVECCSKHVLVPIKQND